MRLEPARLLPALGLVLTGAALVALAGCNAVKDPAYCTSAQDCNPAGGMASVCDLRSHTCHVKTPGDNFCNIDADCQDPMAPRCDVPTSQCAACQPMMDKVAECERLGNTPYCVSLNGTPTCVQCTTSQDCPATAPICGTDHACRGCAEHSECGQAVTCSSGLPCSGSWVCIRKGDLPGSALDGMDGQCAVNGAGGLVTYVATSIDQCSDTNAGTTPQTALCTLDAALQAALRSSRPYVRLKGPGPYGVPAPLSLTSAAERLVVVGAPMGTGAPMAIIHGDDTLFSVAGGATLTVDELEMQENTAPPNAVSCKDKGSTLQVRRSRLRRATAPTATGGAGVYLSDCTAALQRNYIGAISMSDTGHTTGVQINDQTGRQYTIEGNIIAGNLLGIDLSGANKANFIEQFDTIVNNKRSGKAGAVICPGNPMAAQFPAFFAAIIAFNSTTPTGDQLQDGGNCTFVSVAASATQMVPYSGVKTGMDPSLTTGFLLQSPDPCCIDQIDKSPPGYSLPLPDRDILNNPRPYNAKWDLGAHEWRPQ